jgi:hypothetical protein
MNINLVKRVSKLTTTYLVVVDGKKVFYILPATKDNLPAEAEYWNESIGVFQKYSIVEANVLKLLDSGCSETSCLELLVVRGITKEDLEAKLTLMLNDTPESDRVE